MTERAVVLILTLVAACTAGAAEVTVTLRDSAEVARVYYTLGDVAEVRGDEATAATLRALRIGRSPRVGQIDGVARGDVAARLERALPGIRERLVFDGPATTRVRGAGRSVDSADYGPHAEDFLHGWLGSRYDDYELRRVDARRPVSLPLGELDIRPRAPRQPRAARRMNVWLDFFVDGVAVSAVPVWFHVSVQRDGHVAATDLSAGAELDDDDAAAGVVDLAADCERVARDEQLEGGYRLTRTLPPGRPLCGEHLEKIPAVVRGEPVTVRASSGPVIVQALALALEDGDEGDVIEVRRAQGEPKFAVLVTGRQRAEVRGENDD